MKLAVLIIVVVLGLWGAVRASRLRAFTSWRAVSQVMLAVAAFALISWFAGTAYSLLWAVVCAVLGVTSGFFAGRGERVTIQGRQVCVKRSPLVAWIWALAVIVVALTLLFGSSFLFAVAMLPLALAVGMVAGQVAGEFAGVGRPTGQPAAEPAPAADVAASEG
ncbi:MAG: hypothetical protein IMZ74_03720 [Actinobacteria bacterium]|nr:hypothetical protein [Actinomycetota bacterium]